MESVRVHGKGEAGNNSGDGAGKPEALGGDFIAEIWNPAPVSARVHQNLRDLFHPVRTC